MTDPQGKAPVLPPDPGWARRLRHFLFRVVSKAEEDNIFFMAGAITFNLLVALVPLILLLIGISGFVLTSRFPDPASILIPFLLGNLPTGGEVDLVARVQTVIDSLLAERAGFSVVGFLVFVWISTRLVGTLRTVLREIFDFPHGRGIIRGKLFDAVMVLVGGLLFVVNIGTTVLVEAFQEFGIGLVGLEGEGLSMFRQTVAQLLAFAFIWALFVLVYRYFPPRRIPWRTALTAATFTGLLFEVTKYLFSWYLTNAADYTTIYGGLASAAVLFFWIYNSAIVFILGGEVAQVYTMSRTRRLHASNPVPPVNG
ncbi:MAG: YihY/virulence factor BrkB family protein [Gemmatimonadetes bacterium]|nr:YihY/virulence factor BrkB family protein [Gemmatimonadota bacterium]NNM07090.1 YihY/virulence factor BrkB family protein [Gemmatimonadota bacterium]